MSIQNHDSLIKYVKGFYEFENYINKINSNLQTIFKTHHGYLINFEKIEEIKRNINYEENKIIYKNYIQSLIDEDNEKYYTIEEIEFKDPDYLLNMLFNGNKYILINRDLWKLLCEKNKENALCITYEINYNQIKFKLDYLTELFFINQKNNLITAGGFNTPYNVKYKLYQSKYDNIKSIFTQIKNYYDYEKNFENNLKSENIGEYEEGYLVDANWFNKWKEYNDYSNIKSNYLLNQQSQKQIIDWIIYIQQLNKEKKIILEMPKIYKFKNKNQLESFLRNNKLVVIDTSIISFWPNLLQYKIYYYLYKNKINFYFEKKDSLLLDIKNNIIHMKNEDNVENINLLQLIKIFYFRTNLSSEIFSEHENKSINNSIILIKKEIINKYLDYFNYETLYKSLNNINIDYKNLQQKFGVILDIIKNGINNYYEELKLKEIAVPLNFSGKEYYLKPNQIECNGKPLYYISDFEIIDDDIFSFFKEKLMIKDDQIIKGEYLAEDGKIFLNCCCGATNFYQIGRFNITDGKFILEYILEKNISIQKKMIEIINSLGIKKLLSNIKDNLITFGKDIIGYCYELKINDGQKNDDAIMIDSQYNLIDIVSTLIMLIKFEQEIKNKINLSITQTNDLKSNIQSNPFANISCKLVSETFMTEIKNLFHFQKLKNIINKYQSYFNSQINKKIVEFILKKEQDYKIILENKKDDFLELKRRAFEFLKIEVISSSEQKIGRFRYPSKFNVLKEGLYDEFLNLLGLKGLDYSKKSEYEILLTYNKGNIAFKGMNENFVGNYSSLLYIYSADIKQELVCVNYSPKAIIEFKTDDDLNNNFPLITKEDILNKLKYSQSYLFSRYQCRNCLNLNQDIQNNDMQQLSDQYLYDNSADNYFNQLLTFSFLFCFKYKNFYNSIKKSQKQKEEKFYLINKKYLDEIKIISHFKDIEEVLEKYKEIEELYIKEDLNYFIKLKKFLGKNILKKIFEITKNSIKEKLENPNLIDKSSKHFDNDESNNLFYYEKFQIIDEEILSTLEKLDYKIKEKYIATKALFSDNKIILFLNESRKYVINVGKINEEDEFILDYLIQSEFISSIENDLQKIFNEIKKEGYDNFYNNYINNGKIKTEIDNSYIYAQIYNLLSEKNPIKSSNINFQDNTLISKKLRALILLSIEQININKFSESCQKKKEKVYLMNPNYLINYKYEDIVSLINENPEVLNLVEQINNPSYPYDSNIIDLIIEKLNNDTLQKIDKELQVIDQSIINWEAKADIIKLKDKNINICKEFILLREKFFNEIKMNLSLNFPNNFYYYTHIGGDIITSTNNYKYFILFGNINNESHLFNLKYILDFNTESNLNNELEIIRKNGIDFYMKERAIFSEENNKDLISPIFGDMFEIGYFYKYSPGINFGDKKREDFSKYLNSRNLEKVMNLYDYYNEFKEKMEDSNYSHYENKKSYYLINKDVMISIKKDYNYDVIIQTLNKANFNPMEKNKKKKMLYVLKNLPEEIFEDFIKSQKLMDQYEKEFISPNKIPFTVPDPNNYTVNYYNNFEIIDSQIARGFINTIDNSEYEYYREKDDNYLECTLKEGRVIVYYPKEKFNNNKYIYQIGKLNDDNTFIPEYLIIYIKGHSHFEKINYNLNKYLLSIEPQFLNGICPITEKLSRFSEIEEIGHIINLNNIKDPNLFTNPNQNINTGFPSDSTDIKINFIMPPLIGLENIGATCYMNATLQCLCNIPKFVNYFKYNKHLKEIVKNDLSNGNKMLCTSFKLLIEKLWPDNYVNSYLSSYGSIGSNNTYLNKKNDSYAPKDFKTKISTMNELFKGVAANDAKDLVNFLIMTLHEELNTAEKKNLNTNAINQDQRNQQLMFNLFTQDFVNSNKSIISDLFYGVNYNIVQCNGCGCGSRAYNYQTYFFFVFPLEEVRIFKSQNNYNNNFNYNMNFNNNEVNIYDCFLYDQRINYMMGENAMYCNYCKRQCNSQMCTLLAFGPEIIIIILNRGQGAQFKVKVNFQEQLNLYNFIDYKDTGVNYQLIGVITHLGGNDMSGHFIAYCKNPISNSWYQYNDSIVNEVNQANFKAEVIDYAMPYLLFYQKVGK